MKRNALIRIVIWSTVIVLLTGILCGVLFGKNRTERTELLHIAATEAVPDYDSADTPARTGYIGTQANVYASPSTEASRIATLDAGTNVTVSRLENVSGRNWAFLTEPETGWIMTEAVVFYEMFIDTTDTLGTSTPGTATVTEILDVHASPSLEANCLGRLDAGDEVEIRSREVVNGTDWLYITMPYEGWIQAAYTDIGTLPAETSVSVDLSSDSEISLDPGSVQDIEIEWVVGNILIQPIDTDRILVSEDDVSDEKYAMDWKHRNGKLSITFCEESKIGFHFGISVNTQLTKDLTIYVPLDWQCDSLEIDAASANLEVNDLTIRDVEFDGASGECEFENCTVNKIDIDTASGDIRFVGSLDILDCDSASASVYAVLTNTPSRLDMDTMSGDLDITLPPDAGFALSMNALNSDFTSDFDTTLKNGNYVSGDGSCRINIDGMSGNVAIRKGEFSPVESTLPAAPTAPDAPEAPAAP